MQINNTALSGRRGVERDEGAERERVCEDEQGRKKERRGLKKVQRDEGGGKDEKEKRKRRTEGWGKEGERERRGLTLKH